MWDNSENLVSYIRHTSITCDDTGVCEAVLKMPATTGEKPGSIRVLDGKKFGHGNDEDDSHDGSSTSEHSPDIHADVGHRRRSETSKRLETLKLQRLAQSKIKTIQWKEPTASTSRNETGCEFTNSRRSRVSSTENESDNDSWLPFSNVDDERFKIGPSAASTSRTSAVSNLIRASSDLPVNPFQEYMKFDGNASLGSSSKTVRVFPLITSNSSCSRSSPLEVCVTSTAKVSDLIGLICFHYTARNLTPKLSTDTSRYALYVAEDTGEVDSDLPPRSPHENVSRFHFPYLALVDNGAPSSSSAARGPVVDDVKKHCVVVYASTGDKFNLKLDTLDTPLRTIRDQALAMRFAKEENVRRRNMEYNIEKLREPNSTLSLDATVSSTGTTEFVLVRVNSARGDLTPSTPTIPPLDYVVPNACPGPPAAQFYSFPVTMVRKFKRDVKVQLVLSQDRLEISPNNAAGEERKISTNSAAKLLRSLQRQMDGGHADAQTPTGDRRSSKTVNFHISQIGGGEIVDEKAGRKIFRIVHRHSSSGNAGDWKSHQFEADASVAEEITSALNRCLDLSHNETRQEFLRRTPRKSSFFKRLQLGDLSFGEASSGGTTQS